MSVRGWFGLLVGGVFLIGCGDGTGPALAPAERKEALKGTEWVAVSRTLSPGFALDPKGPALTDYYQAGSACYKDDIYRFMANGTFQDDAGKEKCQWTRQDFIGGTWTLNEAGTEIILDMEDQSDSTVWTITSMGEGSLTVTYPSNTGWGDGVKRKETLVLKPK